jgi:hypothetical protein
LKWYVIRGDHVIVFVTPDEQGIDSLNVKARLQVLRKVRRLAAPSKEMLALSRAVATN